MPTHWPNLLYYIRGVQLHELLDPHFWRQLRQEPCVHIFLPLSGRVLISVCPNTAGQYQSVASLFPYKILESAVRGQPGVHLNSEY